MTQDNLPLGDDGLQAVLAEELEDIERRLTEAARSADPLVDPSAGHLLAAGGKRIRPVLVLLTSQFGTGVNDQVRAAAVATELTHLATLYHDDVMDSAPLRRGAPSAHEVWGNSVAILTGDLLFARASRIVADLGPQAVRIQAEAFERLVLGQLHETLGPREDEDPIEHYLQVLADKTGSLIAAAAHYGTIQESGQVVAVLELAADHPARALLRDNAIADDEELILRRVQFSDGAGDGVLVGLAAFLGDDQGLNRVGDGLLAGGHLAPSSVGSSMPSSVARFCTVWRTLMGRSGLDRRMRTVCSAAPTLKA